MGVATAPSLGLLTAAGCPGQPRCRRPTQAARTGIRNGPEITWAGLETEALHLPAAAKTMWLRPYVDGKFLDRPRAPTSVNGTAHALPAAQTARPLLVLLSSITN